VSISSFVVVTHEDPDCGRDPPSPMTQFCQKIDFKGYHDEPRDLTSYIRCEQKHPDNGGGYSTVWKCKLASFPQNGIEMPPQDVAVKVLRVLLMNPEDMDKLIKKLRKEIFIWQQLEHLHILPLYGTTDGFDSIPALVCPWMKNGSLQQYLKKMRHEQLPLEMHRLFSLLFQVVSGLQHLHHKDIIHGDLMPSNVLIDENENALLADFGLSRLMGNHETSLFESLGPGAIRWAAPEIIPLNLETPDTEVKEPNKASDIYSFGCIMMQVLSGQPPYYDIVSETRVTVAKSQHLLPTRPPEIDDVYWRYIERCLSQQVETRPLVDEVLEYIRAECDRS
jgi:serine/threonine protein kinase